jgi:DNA-binding CsgD family transcriptional regulator
MPLPLTRVPLPPPHPDGPPPTAAGNPNPQFKGMSRLQKRLLARERERTALQLRKAGATLEAIAAQLKISVPSVSKAIRRVLSRLEARGRETAEAVRRLELLRLDEMLKVLWAEITAKDAKPAVVQGAVDRVLAIMKQRRFYERLDDALAPKKPTDLEVAERVLAVSLADATTEELYQLRELLQRVRARQEQRIASRSSA